MASFLENVNLGFLHMKLCYYFALIEDFTQSIRLLLQYGKLGLNINLECHLTLQHLNLLL